MKIILSPAKKMNNTEPCGSFGQSLFEFEHGSISRPEFMNTTKEILAWLQDKSFDELKSLWKCNDNIAKQNFERISSMDLYSCLTPAILSYEGIAYQYMAPAVFEIEQYNYVQNHLRILSAFYGALKPMDGVKAYRLEMGAKAAINGAKNLYEYWGKRIYDAVRDESGIIINLASKEYSKCVEKYLTPSDRYISIHFVEQSGDKLVTKGTYAKMARGEMVRFMAENQLDTPEDIQSFQGLGYMFREDLSDETDYIFERKVEKQAREEKSL